MYQKKRGHPVLRFCKFLYLKLVRIHDSPQRIALGFGLGVFLGILPGAGPIASLAAAVFLRVNRVSALLGCLITNTWLSVVTFLVAVKAGSALFGLDAQGLLAQYKDHVGHFHFRDLFQISVLKVFLPVAAGYCSIGLAVAMVLYAVALLVLLYVKQRRWAIHKK